MGRHVAIGEQRIDTRASTKADVCLSTRQAQHEVHVDTFTRTKQGQIYRGADKSLAPPTSRYILFDVYNITFMLVLFYIYIYIYIYIEY